MKRGRVLTSGMLHAHFSINTPPLVRSAKPTRRTKPCALENTKPVEDGKKQLLCSKSRQLVHSSSGSQHTSQGLCDIWLTCFSFSSLFLSHQEKAVHAAPSCHANYSKGIMTLTPFQGWLGWEPIRQMGKTWERLDCNFENWHLKSQKLTFASCLGVA